MNYGWGLWQFSRWSPYYKNLVKINGPVIHERKALKHVPHTMHERQWLTLGHLSKSCNQKCEI